MQTLLTAMGQAEAAYNSLVAALNLTGLEQSYNIAYAAATQTAQSALDAQNLTIATLEATLQQAQRELSEVQAAQSGIVSLQTCVSTAEILWDDAKATDSTDVNIYE